MSSEAASAEIATKLSLQQDDVEISLARLAHVLDTAYNLQVPLTQLIIDTHSRKYMIYILCAGESTSPVPRAATVTCRWSNRHRHSRSVWVFLSSRP
jgi:hypothetical protein